MSKGIDFSAEKSWIRCLAHVINIAVQAALKCIKSPNTNESDVDKMPNKTVADKVMQLLEFFC